MTSVSANNSAALTILQYGNTGASAVGFLSSGGFSASSDDILSAISSAFTGNKGLQQQFNAAYKGWMQKVEDGTSKIHPDNAKHNALTEVISANREAFPAEEFVIRTELPDGASISTTIPSAASVKAETFKAAVTEKQSQYDASVASQSVPDEGAVKLNALSQIVKTLTLDNPDSALVLLEETETASEEKLSKPFLENKIVS